MKKTGKIKLFELQSVRAYWDEEKDKWFFSVQDIVQILSESTDVKQYIKKMRRRDPELASNWGTICTPVAMTASDGRLRKIQAADTQGILRLIQSIPSPKAEPFKQWLAEVGAQRIDETDDPELAFDRAMQTYLAKGYSKEWINQRLKSIEVRKDLTDEWAERGMQQGLELPRSHALRGKAYRKPRLQFRLHSHAGARERGIALEKEREVILENIQGLL